MRRLSKLKLLSASFRTTSGKLRQCRQNRGDQMLHCGRQRSDSRSCFASSSKESKRPAFRSLSICWSQLCAWNSSNHFANSAIFAGGKLAMAVSISFTSMNPQSSATVGYHQPGLRNVRVDWPGANSFGLFIPLTAENRSAKVRHPSKKNEAGRLVR
jgi:hypothetical protein